MFASRARAVPLGPGIATPTFITHVTYDVNTQYTSYTWNGVDLGAGSDPLWVLYGKAGDTDPSSAPTLTIDGVGVSWKEFEIQSGSQRAQTGIGVATGISADTGDIFINLGNNGRHEIAIALYRMAGAQDGANHLDVNKAQTTGGSFLSAPVTTLNNASVFGVCALIRKLVTFTWVGVDEDLDIHLRTGSFTCGHRIDVPDASPHEINVTNSSSEKMSLVTASVR